MNIKNRLKKIEQNSSLEPKEADAPEVCEHPPSMFRLRRDYPAKGYPDRRLIIMGHCDVCGFDDNLWAFYSLTEEQEARRQELQRASDFWALDAYELELVNAGLIRYAVYPPSPEVQIKFTGKVSV
jgi:hypothetical protein